MTTKKAQLVSPDLYILCRMIFKWTKTIGKRIIIALFAIGFLQISSAGAQTAPFTKLFDFNSTASGSHPTELIKSGNFLYGVTPYGGQDGAYGIIFKIKTDGTEPVGMPFYDSYNPNTLTIIDTMVYGIIYDLYGYGQLYSVSTNGNGFDIIHYFNDENLPIYKITSEENSIYGIKYGKYDGTSYLFKVNLDGSTFQQFQSVGDFPYGKVIVAGGHVFGTAAGPTGSTDNNGTIYKIGKDGSGFNELYRFISAENGDTPIASLTAVGSILYGTTKKGGLYGNGVIFSIKDDGTNFQVLHPFQLHDGAEAKSKMVFSGKSLYGATYSGGLNSDHGTLFKINTDGTGFRKLYDFKGSDDGSGPVDLLISNDTIFGITENGGIYDDGTIFSYVIDEPQDLPTEPTPIITLSITKPERITVSTKENVAVSEGVLIDLDTLLSIDGNVAYSHSWNVINNNEFQEVDKQVNIFEDETFYVVVTTEEGCTYSDSVNVRLAKITGLDNQQVKGDPINIFPNPNEGSFRLEIGAEYPGFYTYAVMDIFGRIMTNGQFNCQDACIHDIKVKKIPKGIYTIVVYRDDLFYGKRKLSISN